jgi:colanic acid biosynthesis glycosyl transferase WcaI
MSTSKNGKKVLFLSPFFFPELISTGKYNTHLVKALFEDGNSVKVLASYPLYPDWQPKDTNENINGVEIIRGGLGVRYANSQVIKRIILELWFAYFVLKILIRDRKKDIDIVIAVFPPVVFMLFANLLIPRKTIRVGIVHDLLGVMAKSDKKLSRRVVSKLMKMVEARALKKCDRVVCLSESMRNLLIEDYGVNSSKCIVQYPFITTERAAVETRQLSNIFDKGHFHVVYSGALGEKQRPRELAKFLKLLCETRKDVKCHIFSRGPHYDELRQWPYLSDTAHLSFHDLVPEGQLTELYDRSAVQIIPQAEGTGAGAFPSKLPNLLAHGVPVFAICDNDSELTKIIGKTSYCKQVGNWNTLELVQKMSKFLDELDGVTHQEVKNQYESTLIKMFSVDALVEYIVQD